MVHLFDVLGRRVSTLYRGRPAAEERVRVRLKRALTSGTHVIRLQAEGAAKTRKGTVVRWLTAVR